MKASLRLLAAFALSCIGFICFELQGWTSSTMSIFQPDNPAEVKPLSIYIEDIPARFHTQLTKGNCSDCSCKYLESDYLEPLIHCLIKSSPYVTKSKKDATFIFVPVYTNMARKASINPSIQEILKDDDAFNRWKGARHLVVDAILKRNYSDTSFMTFPDQHLVITSSLTTAFIRSNRWMNSRHILVPPLQKLSAYPRKAKSTKLVYIGDDPTTMEEAKKNAAIVYTSENFSLAAFIKDIPSATFTMIHPSQSIHPTVIYDVIRANSIPILLMDSFLPAFANTILNYSDFSMRISPNNVTTLAERMAKFDISAGLKKIERAAEILSWPLDGKIGNIDASAALFDFLITRHRVLKPVLRRTFLGSDEFI